MTPLRPYARLASLLGSMFSNHELRQLLLTHAAPDIHEDLPSPRLAKGEYMARIAEILLGQEQLTPELLAAWIDHAPARRSEILELQRDLDRRTHVADSVAEHQMRVPALPPHHVERGELADMVAALLGGDKRGVGLDAAGPGVGTTMLAAACARDQTVRAHFADGVYWLTVGPRPRLLQLLKQLAYELGVSHIGFDTPGQGQRRLRTFLQDKRVLVVLDDVWDADHAAALDVGGMFSRVIVTTRERDALLPNRALIGEVGAMQEDEAVALLARCRGAQAGDDDEGAAEVARACGLVPLALAMAGTLARRGQLSWGATLEAIEQARAPEAQQPQPGEAARQTFRVMAASMQVLAEQTGADIADLIRRYADLAVFDHREPIPRSTLRVMWMRQGTMDEAAVDELARALARHGLADVQEDDSLGWYLRLHELQHAYAQACAGEPAALQGELVDAYAHRYKRGFARGPVDGYFFRKLPFHVSRAGRGAALRELLLDFDWLDAKLRIKSPDELVADFELMRGDDELELVGDALRLSTQVLTRDADQLAGHLLARLGHFEASHPGVAGLLARARARRGQVWLRPLTPSLKAPGGPFVRAMVGHENSVNAVAVTPDGKRAVSGSYDNTLRVWDLDTATELRRLEGHTDWVWAVAVSPGGDRALSASMDLTMKLWDLRTGAELRTFAGHDDSVLSLAITPDGSRALSASDDQTVAVWDLDTGARVLTLSGHADRVWSVAPAPGGKRAVSGSSDGTIKVWDLERGVEERTLAGHTGWVIAVAVTPDGKHVVSASADQTLRVWDMDSGEELRILARHENPVTTMAVTPDGKRVLAAARGTAVTVWDLDAGAEVRTLSGHSSSVLAVAATPDGKGALSASHDQSLVLWNLEPSVDLREQASGAAPVVAVVVRPTGSGWTATAVSQDKRFRAWEAGRRAEICTLASSLESISAAALTPDGACALITAYEPALEVWDVHNRSLLRTLNSRADSVVALAITDDGQRALSGSLSGLVEVWDVHSGAVQRTITAHTGSVLAVAITPDGKRALSASVDRTLKLWDLDTGQELWTLPSHSDSIVAADISADSKRAVTASMDQTVAVWNLETGEMVTLFIGEAPMRACALSPGGDVIAAGDQWGGVHLLELQDPRAAPSEPP